MPRYYGRRRRYSRRRYGTRRRRPNAARATQRLTLAPRHQYLKLKWNWTGKPVYGGVNDEYSHCWGLQTPFDPTRAASAGSFAGTQGNQNSVLGWTQYQQLFSKYVVHGVKIKMVMASNSVRTSDGSYQFQVITNVSPEDCGFDGAGGIIASLFSDMKARPYARSFIMNGDRPVVDKRYINMNRLFGEVVRKHDRYVHDWEDSGTTPVGNSRPGEYRMYMVDTANYQHGTGWPAINITMTYYISALYVKSDFLPPLAAALVADASAPLKMQVGDRTDPVAQEMREGLTTGVAAHKEVIDDLNRRQ